MTPVSTRAQHIKLTIKVAVTGTLPTNSHQAQRGGLKRLHAALNRLGPSTDANEAVIDNEVNAYMSVVLTGQPIQITHAIQRFEKEIRKIGLAPVVVPFSSRFADDKLQQAWREHREDLRYRHRRVLEKYYGLSPDRLLTNLDEIGRLFNVTRERIRQIAGEGVNELLERVSAE